MLKLFHFYIIILKNIHDEKNVLKKAFWVLKLNFKRKNDHKIILFSYFYLVYFSSFVVGFEDHLDFQPNILSFMII